MINKIKKIIKNHPSIHTKVTAIYRKLTLKEVKIKTKGNNNKITNNASSLKGCRIKIKGNCNIIIFNYGVQLNKVKIEITGDNHILIIGKNSSINEHGRIRIEDHGNKLEIGDSTHIQSCFFSLADINTKIQIGNDCLFSSDIVLRTSDSHSIINKQTMKRINYGNDINIGNHVWLSNGVNILKGVNIENDAVIGTKSIVTKDIPSGVVACGNPAKIVKQNITWEYERIN